MATYLESVRIPWSATDEQFFRIVHEVFGPTFLAGATVLLASYDPDPAPATAAAPTATSAQVTPTTSAIAA
ncbi:MAG: hypothetical protein ACRDWY_14960 [Actinomycetes bacterium]